MKDYKTVVVRFFYLKNGAQVNLSDFEFVSASDDYKYDTICLSI